MVNYTDFEGDLTLERVVWLAGKLKVAGNYTHQADLMHMVACLIIALAGEIETLRAKVGENGERPGAKQ